MAVEWKRVRLGDFVRVVHGWPFKSDYFTETRDGRPIVVNIGNFRYTGGFRFDSTARKEYTGAYPKEYELSANDILLVMTCQTSGGEILGIPGRIPNDENIYLHNQRLGKVVIKDTSRINSNYVYYLSLWSEFNRELCTSASGTKILHTAPARIEGFEFKLPPLAEQQAIASILGALDDKIELNRRMNASLEAMARALFQRWFVDFDPVRAKMDGREPAGMDAETAALFPDSFSVSRGGMIPNGWKSGVVSDVAELIRESVNPGLFPDEVFDHFSLPAFDDGRMPKADRGSEILSNKSLVRPESVLLSKLNPHIPRIWLPSVDATRRAICSTEFLVACTTGGYAREFLFSLFSSAAFSTVYGTLVSGTTGSHQRIQASSLMALGTLLPPIALAQRFTDVVRPMFAMVHRNSVEARALAQLRDTLLPRLLTGELRVAHAGDASAAV